MVVGQALVSGLLIGAIYSLVALGLTLIFGVLRIINFAQGALMMIAMYLTFWMWSLWDVNPYLSAVVVVPLLFLLGMAIESGLIERVIKAREENQLLLTMGVSLILVNGAQVLWSSDYRTIKSDYGISAFRIGDISISVPRLVAFGVAFVVAIALFAMLKGTKFGRSVRAVAQQPDAAAVVGIDLKRVRSLTFGIGTACAAIPGVLLMPFFHVQPYVGEPFSLLGFVIVVLGGMGSAVGALIGGLMLGVAEALGAVYLPGSVKELMVFLVFILVLVLRPEGIFGRRTSIV